MNQIIGDRKNEIEIMSRPNIYKKLEARILQKLYVYRWTTVCVRMKNYIFFPYLKKHKISYKWLYFLSGRMISFFTLNFLKIGFQWKVKPELLKKLLWITGFHARPYQMLCQYPKPQWNFYRFYAFSHSITEWWTRNQPLIGPAENHIVCYPINFCFF